MTLDTFVSLDEGDAAGAWLLSVLAQNMVPRTQVVGDAAAMALTDAAYARRFFASPADRGAIGSATTEFSWAGGRLVDAWPANPDEQLYNRVRDSRVETLLVGGALDFSTPPQVATRELLANLPNGQEVVLPKLGHTEDFWAYQPAASTRLIETFLDSGRIDTSLYTNNRLDFTPPLTHGAMAKIVLGVMLALPTLTVLSLLGMVHRVRRRGRFGRVSSALLRSLYPLVLGLGGWFLGALIVLTTMPGVPLDNAPLAVLGVGMPIGLGIYWAWVHRDWSTRSKGAGLAAAAAGALVGAWLGFNATADLLALVTAIVGAAAGANVTLILVDIARDRSIRARRAATASDATPVGSQKVAISR
jgi:hypothetical protein